MIYYGISVQRRSMRRYRLFTSLVFFIACIGSAFAEDLSRCVSSLVLPTSNVFSRNSAVGGIVTADVTIGEDGGLSRLDLDGPTYGLKAEVEVHLTQSKFAVACAGRKVRMTFEYKLEGERTYDVVPPRIIFRPPLSFTIVVRPGKPTTN